MTDPRRYGPAGFRRGHRSGGRRGGYLLDGIPNVLYAWSTLQLVSGDGELSMGVRSQGAGNPTDDIGFAAGSLDTAAIATLCGANNGDMDKAYDQSGNGNTYAQATAGKLPAIYNGSSVPTRGAQNRPSPDFDVPYSVLERSDCLGMTGSPGLDIYIAFQADSVAAIQFLYAFGDITGGQTVSVAIDDADTASFRFFDGNRILDFAGEDFTSGVSVLHAYCSSGAQYGAYEMVVNGVQGVEASATNPTNTTNLQNTHSEISGRGDGESPATGGILAVIVAGVASGDAHTAGERASVRAALSALFQ